MKNREIGHPMDVERLKRARKSYGESRGEFLGKRPGEIENREISFFVFHLDTSFRLARINYFFNEPPAQVLTYASERLGEIKTLFDFGYIFASSRFRTALLAAIWAGDRSTCEMVCSLPDETFHSSEVTVSECGYLLLEAIQALGRKDDKSAADKIARARSLCNDQDLIVNPRSEKALYQPFLGLCEALLSRDSQAFAKAAAARQKWWKKEYGKKSESANNEGILDLELLGLMRLAQRRGMELPAGNLYAPLELLEIETGG